jgi:hypothetical protein
MGVDILVDLFIIRMISIIYVIDVEVDTLIFGIYLISTIK